MEKYRVTGYVFLAVFVLMSLVGGYYLLRRSGDHQTELVAQGVDLSDAEQGRREKLVADSQGSGTNIGRTLVDQQCTSCHTLEPVYKAKKNRSEWTTTVNKMIMYSDRMDFLNQKEKKTVIAFLTDRKTSNLTGN